MSAAVLGLGTASLLSGYGLGAGAEQVDGQALIAHALRSGILYLDTAAVYGDSERILGLFAEEIRTRAIRIATKLTSAQLIAGELAASLARLEQPSVDTLMLHSATAAELTRAGIGSALSEARQRGAITRAGASTYGAADARVALSQAWCDAVQVEFSLLNPNVLHAIRDVRRAGQQVIVRSVFCKGLLTARRSMAPIPAEARALLDRLEALAASWSLTLPELALRFALDTPGVDVVVIGAGAPSELDTALVAHDRAPLTAAQLDALTAFDRSSESWTHPETWTASVP